MRSILFSLAWGVSLVQSAIYPNGTQAVAPVTEEDASPIGNPRTYYPDQHDCPLACKDYTNIHSWITYFSVDRFRRCKKPMLLQLSVSQPLDKTDSTVMIRSCTLGSDHDQSMPGIGMVENPKKASHLVLSGLETAPACIWRGAETQTQDQVKVATTSGGGASADGGDAAGLLEGMRAFFDADDNCDEAFLFAYHNQTVGAVYIGAQIGKPTVGSTLQALAQRLSSNNVTGASRTVAELCGGGRSEERMFGVVLDTTGDVVGVQKMALEWSKGKCAPTGTLAGAEPLASATVWEIAGRSNTTLANATDSDTNNTATRLPLALRFLGHAHAHAHGTRSRHVGHSEHVSTAKRAAPQPAADGTCATHLIVNDDTCEKLAVQLGVTAADLEEWNKGKTWAWTECKDMLVGYNMCVSDGDAPMPPPQQGAECGPLVPGTQPPASKSTSIASLNPCPLKACCSNWGFCGVFPAHCDIHAPPGGGPGSKEQGFQNTCVANCDNQIKQNSGPPAAFQRIGYYESYNFGRDCLHLKSKNANTDGTYTHMHWAFADIDPTTWTLVIKDPAKQWEDFKKLPNMKRIVSVGGWAYSTELATYNIIRQAIITNRDTFAANLAKFAQDEGIDGIDIDWEYPGAPDIMVGGQPIGQKSDGLNYLKFLTVLKKNLGTQKSVSIAAPASYWYLKAFPIDRIASVIDYIVYMTYDLHGQWDYGNPNAYDMCPSGKCIRSHVNLTETLNSLAMLTKAGVANNKIFVGEASYGRSFRMATDGCWGPTCDFTGSRTESDALPGRCTKTGGYLAYAEITELISTAEDARMFYDTKSNSDIIVYNGDYISYMTPETKDTRRDQWKSLNFAGSIDWAVDLQSFTSDEYDDDTPERPEAGEGCVGGEDLDLNSGTLCEFSCTFGFCPESLCECTFQDTMLDLPPIVPGVNVVAWDSSNVDLNRLCKFACKYGYCPDKICTKVDVQPDSSDLPENGEQDNFFNTTEAKLENAEKCVIFKDAKHRDISVNMCKEVCRDEADLAGEEGRVTNYGCIGFWPGERNIPWEQPLGSPAVTGGRCMCDNWVLNELADFILEALPIIGQIGCYMIMQSIKLVADVGLQFIPGVGKILDAGLDMATTAAQMAAHLYPEEEDPEGAFNWWLSPCGGTDLVPEDIKKVFGILSTVANGVSSFVAPKKIKKGSGKKGDDGNPVDQSKPRSTGASGGKSKPKCKIPPSQSTKRFGEPHNTLRKLSCNQKDETETTELIITSLAYDAAARPIQVKKHCAKEYSQACFHYSSAIKVNPSWATLTCDQSAASTKKVRRPARATAVWTNAHKGKGWIDKQYRQDTNTKLQCDRDEYPPSYLMYPAHPAIVNGGKNMQGQLVRLIPNEDNGGAGQMWRGACFIPAVMDLSDSDFEAKVNAAPNKKVVKNPNRVQTYASVTVTRHPEFTIESWGHSPPKNEGLEDNKCWPKKIASKDPGFVLHSFDTWYGGVAAPYNYLKPYVAGSNGD